MKYKKRLSSEKEYYVILVNSNLIQKHIFPFETILITMLLGFRL